MARTDPRPNYGRKRRVRADGYVDLYRPGHPLARRDGYVFEHRLVVVESGIEIPERHQIHHRNGNRADNRIKNLAVIRIDEHARLHGRANPPTECPSGHAYTPENTARNASGWRYCKCNRERVRAYNHRKRLRPFPTIESEVTQ